MIGCGGVGTREERSDRIGCEDRIVASIRVESKVICIRSQCIDNANIITQSRNRHHTACAKDLNLVRCVSTVDRDRVCDASFDTNIEIQFSKSSRR